jgi:toxin HigB-1
VGKHGGNSKCSCEASSDELAALDTAEAIEDMNIPWFSLHSLKGKLQGRWAVSVSGNWRLTFEFHDGNVHILNYEDYH